MMNPSASCSTINTVDCAPDPNLVLTLGPSLGAMGSDTLPGDGSQGLPPLLLC